MMTRELWDEWEKLGVQIISLQKRRAEIRRMILDGLGAFKLSSLTRRESEIMSYLLSDPGISNKEIAAKINCAERTVKFHISSMLAKYEVDNRRDLVRMVQGEKETRDNEEVLVGPISSSTSVPTWRNIS